MKKIAVVAALLLSTVGVNAETYKKHGDRFEVAGVCKG
jgi:hypothetical protein